MSVPCCAYVDVLVVGSFVGGCIYCRKKLDALVESNELKAVAAQVEEAADEVIWCSVLGKMWFSFMVLDPRVSGPERSRKDDEGRGRCILPQLPGDPCRQAARRTARRPQPPIDARLAAFPSDGGRGVSCSWVV